MKLKHDEIDSYFNQRLIAVGTSPQNPDLLLTWQIFKEFALVPVDCKSEGFIFSASGGNQFTIQFLRYCDIEEIDDDGPWTWPMLIDCIFDFEGTEELEKFSITGNVDVKKDKDRDEYAQIYVEGVEAHQEFWSVIKRHSPTKALVYIGGQ